jgi:hypothetical protein
VENVEQFEVAHDGRHMKEAYHESRKNTHNRGEGSLFFGIVILEGKRVQL